MRNFDFTISSIQFPIPPVAIESRIFLKGYEWGKLQKIGGGGDLLDRACIHKDS